MKVGTDKWPKVRREELYILAFSSKQCFEAHEACALTIFVFIASTEGDI